LINTAIKYGSTDFHGFTNIFYRHLSCLAQPL
jgi:hypothetical protein